MMRLFLDESIHLLAAACLRDLGADVEHLLEARMGGLPDETILAEALLRGAVLVSHDTDFHKILARTNATAPSVILVRLEVIDPGVLAKLLIEMLTLPEIIHLLKNGAAVSLDGETVRGRRLPLR